MNPESSGGKIKQTFERLGSYGREVGEILGRSLEWVSATNELLRPPVPERLVVLRNRAEYSHEEFTHTDSHIFGDSFAQGYQDAIALPRNKEYEPPEYPAAGFIANRMCRLARQNWRVHNHAVGGSSTLAAIDQVRTYRNSAPEETSRPDYHIQVGGIDFITLLDNPEILDRLMSARKNPFSKKTREIPLIIRAELRKYKNSYTQLLEELFSGPSLLPRRLLLYGQPDGSIVDPIKTRMLAISRGSHSLIQQTATKDEKLTSLFAGHTTQLIENAATDAATEFYHLHKEELQDIGTDIHVIRYRDYVERKHIRTEHPNIRGQQVIAEAIAQRSFYRGRSLAALLHIKTPPRRFSVGGG